MDRLAKAAGHADRSVPLRSYCTGLLLPGERKSVEPMAARLAPENVRRMHQSLHHVVADAPWNDEEVLRAVRDYVLPVMQKKGPVVCWVVAAGMRAPAALARGQTGHDPEIRKSCSGAVNALLNSAADRLSMAGEISTLRSE